MKIILASKSKRRIFLLKKTGLNFRVIKSNLNESLIEFGNSPKKYCQKLSILKAQLVAKDNPDNLIIAADTIVNIKNKILEKPLDYNDAVKMLKCLRGKEHFVHTGVAIISLFNKISINFVIHRIKLILTAKLNISI